MIYSIDLKSIVNPKTCPMLIAITEFYYQFGRPPSLNTGSHLCEHTVPGKFSNGKTISACEACLASCLRQEIRMSRVAIHTWYSAGWQNI